MPRPPKFFVPDEEEDEVEFIDNDAYESATPQPKRREFLSQDTHTSSTHTDSLPKPSIVPRCQSSSPVLPPRHGSTQPEGTVSSGSSVSGASGASKEDGPRFEISRQQERGRGAVFEKVTIKSRV